MAGVLEGYNVPWTAVWGNHDQERGLEYLDKAQELLLKHEHFVYEQGPIELGRGNFVIAIKEENKLVHALVMMDTHDKMPKPNTENELAWAKLTPSQLEWYKDKINELKTLGCIESTIMVHIPIYAYNIAFEKAFKAEIDLKSVKPQESHNKEYWNDGYEGSFGVKYEGICSYIEDDGAFDVIKELDNTKNVICGHDHVNNFSIEHEGVRLTFTLKTGAGCYWNSELNGGTTITINEKGYAKIKHEYVSVG